MVNKDAFHAPLFPRRFVFQDILNGRQGMLRIRCLSVGGSISGHSKWSTIKRQKGANDAKRGQMFTKYANAITIAARSGGGNPDANFRLRLAIEAARAINMPKDNIERAVTRGAGGPGGAGALEEVVYEGYAPGGVAIMIEAVTDNRQRTGSQVRSLLDKKGGTLAGPGAVSFQFKKQGEITVKLEGKDPDEATLEIIDYGAEDVETAGKSLIVYTKPEELEAVKNKLTEKGFEVEGADLTQLPTTTVAITDKSAAEKVLNLVENLEELDDVQKVFANFDVTDDLLISNTGVTQ
jgi:YebC/PmpR family DNA-binding regulatory protein